MEDLRVQLRLDDPILVQFGRWVWGYVRGDLGTSLFTQRSVVELMISRLEPTLSLTIVALIMSVLMGVSAGVAAAWKANSFLDKLLLALGSLGISLPSFYLGLILIWAFAVKVHIFPAVGYISISEGPLPWLRSLILPSTMIAVYSGAVLARMTRSVMLEVLREDYVRTARSKGLSERVVYLRHALQNASLTIITITGLLFAALVTGTLTTEIVFAIPGMGRLVVDAMSNRDYPIVQSTVMMVAMAYVIINLAVDILYGYLDPRVRY